MLGGEGIPFESFRGIFGNALAVFVERREIIFRGGVMLERGRLVILEGLGIIARDTLAVFIEIAEKELGIGIILSGGGAKPLEGGLRVRGGRVMSQQGFCELVLRQGIALLGAGLKIGYRDGGCLRSLWRGMDGWNGREGCCCAQ